MGNSGNPVDVSAELLALQHEKKNQKMKVLPPNTIIQKRPLHHPPIASPSAGKNVEKVVYVSSHTPIMSAVKRVKKLLSHIEQRAIQSVDAKGRGSVPSTSELAEVSDRLREANEEVLVKASGRAMSQALRVAEWFRNREKEMLCNVQIRTSSVQAIDDIVEVERNGSDSAEDLNAIQHGESTVEETTELTEGETTMELLGDVTETTTKVEQQENLSKQDDAAVSVSKDDKQAKKRRTRRRRPAYDKDDVPEARIRWVKTVEVGISLKA